MAAYLAARLVQSLAVLLVMSLCIYALIGLMPGDPADLLIAADPRATSADILRIKAIYGLDRPLIERWVDWLAAALTGDFGLSRLYARPVTAVLPQALANTALLIGAALVSAVVLAIALGTLAGKRAFSRLDTLINATAFIGISTPPFWLALVLILVFAVVLGWLPAGGLPFDGAPLTATLSYLVLPVATLTGALLGGYLRHVRRAMIDTLNRDFIRTARAKGLGERRIIRDHALRPALIPLVTVVAVDAGALVSGALVTETVFAYPGMGRLIYDAILGNDFNLALMALLLATAMTLAANLLADVAHAALDPRVRLTGGGDS